MKNFKKLSQRGLSVLLALVMCASMLPVNAFAAELADEDIESNIPAVTAETENENKNEAENGENETENDARDTEDEKELTPDDEHYYDWESMDDTKRPWASDTVDNDAGNRFVTSEDGENVTNKKFDPEDDNWEIFYDADHDVYNITFNIGSEAEGTQVIDLTQALELLGKYAEAGKQELQDDISKLDRPNAPGKPEGLDENVNKAYADIIASVPRSAEGEPAESYDYAGTIAEATGLSKDDPYVKDMASYMYDQAMVDWCMDS